MLVSLLMAVVRPATPKIGMILHGDVLADDDWAVSGTNIGAGDFPDASSGVIARDFGSGPVPPQLYDILAGVYDTVAANLLSRSELHLQANIWTTVERIQHPVDLRSLTVSDSASTSANTVRADNSAQDLHVRARYIGHAKSLLPITLSWVNAGASQWLATTANEDGVAVLYLAYPGNGYKAGLDADGRPRVDTSVTRKASDAAATAADAWYNAINEALSDDTPGLDPTKTYILVGIS